jgi:hypothetical protein
MIVEVHQEWDEDYDFIWYNLMENNNDTVGPAVEFAEEHEAESIGGLL